MEKAHPLLVLWRRKWVIAATFAIFVSVTAIASKTLLPKVYESSATLWISQRQDVAAFDAVQASQVLARTYSNIIASDNVAGRVASRMPFPTTGPAVKQHMTFEPVSETQLLRITAEDGDAQRAKLYANSYAAVFIAYSRQRLGKINQSTVTLADPASLPVAPARPKPTLYTTLAAVLGLIIGSMLAFLAEFLDRRVHSLDELQEVLGVPVLCPVPRRTARNKQSQIAFDESFRFLRANLQFARTDRPLQSLTITSPSDGEGKTTTSVNLARAFAESGQRVVVVEGDLRRPGLTSQLVSGQARSFPVGLSNYLVRGASLDDIIQPTAYPNILLIPAGPIPPNPSTLLASGRLPFDELARRSDVCIIDTPPLSVGADASLLASHSDGVLLVVDINRSRKPAPKRALEQLTVAKVDLIGVVANRVRGAGPSYYPYYASPLNYFTPGVRSQLESVTGHVFGTRPRTAKPIGGTYMQDEAGTAQGNWFFPGSYYSNTTDVSGALGLAAD